MKSCLNLCLGALGSMAALASMNASAHGWVEYPNARQNICYEDGGIWNNSIPNAACQAAFDKSGAYPFVQRNEVAALVPGYRDMSQVMATVKDGELCGASDPAKAGLNVPSPHWQKTKLALDGNNRFELVFNATAPHNPSYWEFYLSKPEYDDTRPLTWADLDLVSTSDNVAVGADKKYRIKVTLPAGREGSAILFTRWQRIDAAGEGFYNCSDITFSDEKSTEPTEPKPNLEALGYLVQQGFGPVAPGDTIRFRTFNENGTEQQDISLAITARNLNTKIWSAELAGQFNSLTSGNWFIGIWHDEMSHYMFDSKNIFANQVHAPAAKYSYQLSLIKGDVTPPPTPPTHHHQHRQHHQLNQTAPGHRQRFIKPKTPSFTMAKSGPPNGGRRVKSPVPQVNGESGAPNRRTMRSKQRGPLQRHTTPKTPSCTMVKSGLLSGGPKAKSLAPRVNGGFGVRVALT